MALTHVYFNISRSRLKLTHSYYGVHLVLSTNHQVKLNIFVSCATALQNNAGGHSNSWNPARLFSSVYNIVIFLRFQPQNA